MQPIHRITKNAILQFTPTTDTIDFYKIDDSEINLLRNQYLLKSINSDIQEKEIEKIVWESGDFAHRLNKVSNSSSLFIPTISTVVENKKYTLVRLLLKQGFNWFNSNPNLSIFALHVIIKKLSDSINDEEILISRIVTIDEFVISGNKLVIDGNFWMEEFVFKIPTQDQNIVAQVTEITYGDIVGNVGQNPDTILNFPFNFEVLVEDKPMPDYIRVRLNLDENHFLNIKPTTDENKSVEQSILDYFFGENSGLKLEVNLRYIVSYGNPDFGYKTLVISNFDDAFGQINVGLNFLTIFGTNSDLYPTPMIIDVNVLMEVSVDNKILRRTSEISSDLAPINPFLINVVSETIDKQNYPVEVVNQNIIQNTLIEANESVKIVEILQPVFIEFIQDTIVFEPKNITFPTMVSECYLKLVKTASNPEQIIKSHPTSDGKFYFDLTEFSPIDVETSWELINANSLMIIGAGKIVLS